MKSPALPLTDEARYCEFFRLQGFRALQSPNAVWVELHRGVFQQSPPFRFDRDLTKEASEMLRQTKGFTARWFSRAREQVRNQQHNAYTPLYFIRPPYDLRRLTGNARSHTRRGLKRVHVESVSFDAGLEPSAYSVYADNVQRLELFRNNSDVRQRWAQWVRTLSSSPCTEFWGAWENGHLVAFTVVLFSPRGAEIVLQRSLGAALKLYPNNALLYRITVSVFERGIPFLSFGLGEFGAKRGGLDHFKQGMGFEEVLLEDHFALQPRLGWLRFLLTTIRLRWLARTFQSSRKYCRCFDSAIRPEWTTTEQLAITGCQSTSKMMQMQNLSKSSDPSRQFQRLM